MSEAPAKADDVLFPEGATIISWAPGGVRLVVQSEEEAAECTRLYCERWDPRGYGTDVSTARFLFGESYMYEVHLTRYLHCD